MTHMYHIVRLHLQIRCVNHSHNLSSNDSYVTLFCCILLCTTQHDNYMFYPQTIYFQSLANYGFMVQLKINVSL